MRKKLKVLGLSYSQTHQGAYVVVLSEVKGNRKLPIIIKSADAQQIALKVEGMKSPRPLTHDLIKNITDNFGMDIQEVYIYSMLEGIFYTKFVITNGVDEHEIECTAGDGISLAVLYGCSLYADEDVLEISGISTNDDGTLAEEDYEDESKIELSVEDLEHMMEDALSNEEYEIAAEIRDKIKKLKGE